MKKYLIVVDVQKDFVDGALGTVEAVKIIPRVKEKIAEYMSNGDTVIYTRDTHEENYLSTNEGKYLPVKHCIKDSEGWQIYDGVYMGGKIVDKPTFGYLHWKDVISESGNMEIELIGLCTDICVVSNALILKATFPDATVSVDPCACAGVTPETHDSALATMKMCQIEIL